MTELVRGAQAPPAEQPAAEAPSAGLGQAGAARALARWRAPTEALADREFLAPALEILETPASPVRMAFLWIICAFAAVALALAYFGRIDIIASAQGKFQPAGRVKVIEPLETGRVAAILVANGSRGEGGRCPHRTRFLVRRGRRQGRQR